MTEFENFLNEIGLNLNHQILVHSSFKAINKSFHISGQEVISSLKNSVNPEKGSIIFPAFTYCFKNSYNSNEIFDRNLSPSKVGYLSELFRNSENVIRTLSPTHSFSMWGKVTSIFDESNSPESPLGKDSICAWLDESDNSYVLMLNTDFSAFTMGHFYEIKYQVPWYDFSPWQHLGVEKIGVSTNGAQKLKEIPGCAKSFTNFESYLLDRNLISRFYHNDFWAYYVNLSKIKSETEYFYKNKFINLLCDSGKCKTCDSRREFLMERGLL